MAPYLWLVILGCIVSGVVCFIVYNMTGLTDGYNGGDTGTAIVAAIITLVVSFGLWFLVSAMGNFPSPVANILPWILSLLIWQVICWFGGFIFTSHQISNFG